MMRSVLVMLFWRAAHADDRCVGGWQTGDGYGGGSSYETHIGNYASREQCIDAVKSRNDGANAATYTVIAWSPYIVGDCFAEYGQTSVSYTSYWENCLFASDDQSAGSRDLDGDGVADAAAEGDCCINGYGIEFAGSSCGNTLAEVTANCCWSPFVARYSMQPDHVDQNAFDCVSFISKEDCNARGALWSDASMAGQCRHAVNGDWGTGNGWCSSDLDDHVGDTSTASACWTMCENTYGSDLVAIDWTPDGECYCQDDCQCMEDTDDGDIHLITRSDVAALPNTCASACPAEEASFQTCLSMQWPLNDDYFADDDDDSGGGGGYFLANGLQSCDDACASAGGCNLEAITAAASSLEACKSILDDLDASYVLSGIYSDDNSGCTHVWPDDGGWAQVMDASDTTCDAVNSAPTRRRVCACNDDDDDDDFSPNTCADVQEWLSTGECADGPSVCRAEYDAWVECHYEDMAREEIGQTCDFTCSPDKKSNGYRDKVILLILIIVCSVAGVCCLLALGTAAAFGALGSCACCAKKKKTPTRVAEPSAPSAPVPLAVAEYYAAPPPMSPGTLAKTQEHIRRTAALMAEAPPSPGPPPLAPIKATETPSTAFAAEEAPAAEGWAAETMAAEPPPPPSVEAYAPEAELEPES